jgi:hypothetical protein
MCTHGMRPRAFWATPPPCRGTRAGAPCVWREGDGDVMMLMGTDAADGTTSGLLTSPDGVHGALLPEQEHCRDRGGAGGQGHQQPPNTALPLTASSVHSAPASGSI